ncbi:MAG: hypothetical protein KH972_07305 [Peptostreptococcaceae bacterium]|nr:hypothetical protein [Peptostreptococcaceae bacterium]
MDKKAYTLEEYKKTNNMMWVNDTFFQNIDDFIDDLAWEMNLEELKQYRLPKIYATTKHTIDIDETDITERLEEHPDAYEDYEISAAGLAFIKNFVREYNEKYADCSYTVEDVEIKLTAAEKEYMLSRIGEIIKERNKKQ